MSAKTMGVETCLAVLGLTDLQLALRDNLFRLSLAEHLKDARRWRFIRDHCCPPNIHKMTPTEIEDWVDTELGRKKT